jgi:hypothetical protein
MPDTIQSEEYLNETINGHHFIVMKNVTKTGDNLSTSFTTDYKGEPRELTLVIEGMAEFEDEGFNVDAVLDEISKVQIRAELELLTAEV